MRSFSARPFRVRARRATPVSEASKAVSESGLSPHRRSRPDSYASAMNVPLPSSPRSFLSDVSTPQTPRADGDP